MTDTDLQPYLESLRAHGAVFDVSPTLRHEPDQPGSPARHRPDWPALLLPDAQVLPECRDRVAKIGSDHATWSVIAALQHDGLVSPGCRFWDIGCGTGLIAIAAAQLGAARVVATDIDARCVALTCKNAEDAGVSVACHLGSLFAAVPDGEEVDVVAANLPHKPTCGQTTLHLAENGGPHGDRHWEAFREQARARLRPGGRLVFFLHSLAPPRLLQRMGADFDVTLLSWKRRFLDDDEFVALRECFRTRHDEGTSYLASADGRTFLVACVWLAVRRGA